MSCWESECKPQCSCGWCDPGSHAGYSGTQSRDGVGGGEGWTLPQIGTFSLRRWHWVGFWLMSRSYQGLRDRVQKTEALWSTNYGKKKCCWIRRTSSWERGPWNAEGILVKGGAEAKGQCLESTWNVFRGERDRNRHKLLPMLVTIRKMCYNYATFQTRGYRGWRKPSDSSRVM